MLAQLKLILEILPIVVQAIRSVEALFPDSGKGPVKSELLFASAKLVEEVYGKSIELIPIIEKLVPIVVSIFNRFGIFKTAESVK